jgi:protein-S-isoprenylcysteine O-methyltransferase Ste14
MNDQQKVITPRVIAQVLVAIVLFPFLPLLISGQWGWWEAWVYAFIFILGFAISRAIAARRHPDLLVDRARFSQHEKTKGWDKTLVMLMNIGVLLSFLIIGLDARLEWSPTYCLGLKVLALVVIIGGYALGSYALIENRFFSGMVRIQDERGHYVVTSGPYRWMRHPGYAGGLLTYLATPVFLDSNWAFLPIMFMCIVMVIRTFMEDRMLQMELEGYSDYARRVRYRLLPGVW